MTHSDVSNIMGWFAAPSLEILQICLWIYPSDRLVGQHVFPFSPTNSPCLGYWCRALRLTTKVREMDPSLFDFNRFPFHLFSIVCILWISKRALQRLQRQAGSPLQQGCTWQPELRGWNRPEKSSCPCPIWQVKRLRPGTAVLLVSKQHLLLIPGTLLCTWSEGIPVCARRCTSWPVCKDCLFGGSVAGIKFKPSAFKC